MKRYWTFIFVIGLMVSALNPDPLYASRLIKCIDDVFGLGKRPKKSKPKPVLKNAQDDRLILDTDTTLQPGVYLGRRGQAAFGQRHTLIVALNKWGKKYLRILPWPGSGVEESFTIFDLSNVELSKDSDHPYGNDFDMRVQLEENRQIEFRQVSTFPEPAQYTFTPNAGVEMEPWQFETLKNVFLIQRARDDDKVSILAIWSDEAQKAFRERFEKFGKLELIRFFDKGSD